MSTIETIARGVCINNNHLLLCRSRGGGAVSYLPGGHIEFQEQARTALEREIMEELGQPSRAGRFLGCCEHTFIQKAEPHTEIYLVFELDICTVNTNSPHAACEAWISFFWQPLAQLEESDLQPAELRQTITQWLQNAGFATSGDLWCN